jgi:excisionase family DNA binding protein
MERLLTPGEVAAALRVTPRTVRRYAADGQLSRVRLGGRLARYTVASVEALILRNESSRAAEPGSTKTSGVGGRSHAG